jgi:(p)ppGpp synthase/HD superfamily hydrolase
MKDKEGESMRLIELAIEVAAKGHQNQYRKLTDVPYITHPYNVGLLLLKEGCREEVVCAGILHDTVEDTEITLEDIRTQFGTKVAELVESCTEPNKDASWEKRKQHTIDRLKELSKDSAMIVCADKLHNLRSIRQDLERTGENAWGKFKRGRDKQEWYYQGILENLSQKLAGEPLFEEFKTEMNLVFCRN